MTDFSFISLPISLFSFSSCLSRLSSLDKVVIVRSSFNIALIVRIILCLPFVELGTETQKSAYAEHVPYDRLWREPWLGFPLILNAWNEKHWIKPELLEQPELMQVKLTLHIQNKVASGSLNDPINDPINLTERQKMILQMFSEEKNLSRERLCEETELSDATAKHEITFLKKREEMLLAQFPDGLGADGFSRMLCLGWKTEKAGKKQAYHK